MGAAMKKAVVALLLLSGCTSSGAWSLSLPGVLCHGAGEIASCSPVKALKFLPMDFRLGERDLEIRSLSVEELEVELGFRRLLEELDR